MTKQRVQCPVRARVAAQALAWVAGLGIALGAGRLERDFAAPPAGARPWVYWMWMDGNLSRAGITADLEAMTRAGIGGVMIMEVDVGIPRGPVKFMSPEWRQLFKHVVAEAERLGIAVTLNAGPGWTGSGGPWVPAEQSMQHIVASALDVAGPANLSAVLPRPESRPPYFGTGGLPPEMVRVQREFYRDVAVLAFPTPGGEERVADIEEKALYLRHPFSSMAGVKAFLPSLAEHPALAPGAAVDSGRIVDLTGRLEADGRLDWPVPPGRWTVLRFGRTSTGANTRPAPAPGLGLECDKFDRAALDAHFDAFVGSLLREIGPGRQRHAGWQSLHIDSWEMGAQNWTAAFPNEFRQRRGYAPLRYLPAVTGRIVDSREVTERFLWDLRQTAQELVIENHALQLRELAHRQGLGLSIEPYDMNPTADLNLGAVADVPMGEFWANCFDTAFSCFEASSIAHTLGRPIVAAESFTSDDQERWRLHPGSLKALGDWAFAAGINRIVFHRYAHQPWLDRWPGMTMGPYGVHWERTQTFWDLVGSYHQYLARCQFLLRQGAAVADILYLTPEGAPHVFRPPASAVAGQPPDRREFNFDACSPGTLAARAEVRNGRIAFKGGTSYRLLVLPGSDTMTPGLVRRVRQLVRAGATAVGDPPRKSPSLSGYPACDSEVHRLAVELWGDNLLPPPAVVERRVGQGRIVWGGDLSRRRGDRPDPGEPLREAKWIWFKEGQPASAAPVGRRYFRRSLVLPAGEIESGTAVLTADNAFTLRVNGREAGGGDNFTQVRQLNIAPFLRAGTNLLAVLAVNGGESPNPAGLVAAVRVRMRAGPEFQLSTDARWQAAAGAGPDGSAPATETAWEPAIELGTFGMAPWGQLTVTAAPAEIYAGYSALAAWLRAEGASPDFESDGPLRYTHRRDGGTDLYFVANRSAEPQTATAAFRVGGKAPELWDPLTGGWRRAVDWTERDGRAWVPLRFEPYGSMFVVFRRSARPPRHAPGGRNWDEFAAVAELAGPWDVQFPPGRGAPAALRFDTLSDWSRHPDAGVRHFSGQACYRLTFQWNPAAAAEAGKTARNGALWVDLGRVAVMARVTLNGRDLGTVWTAPFRVPTRGALRTGTNRLEVQVANLWPNRLIGDAALPAERRVAWTTWNPFGPGDPLIASGLLGPVRILAAQPDHAPD
jgi:hypothetical protein